MHCIFGDKLKGRYEGFLFRPKNKDRVDVGYRYFSFFEENLMQSECIDLFNIQMLSFCVFMNVKSATTIFSKKLPCRIRGCDKIANRFNHCDDEKVGA